MVKMLGHLKSHERVPTLLLPLVVTMKEVIPVGKVMKKRTIVNGGKYVEL